MSWAAMCATGLSKPRFILPNCRINADYYIKLILEPFPKKDIRKPYQESNLIFHQDFSPSQVAKKTIEFLKSK